MAPPPHTQARNDARNQADRSRTVFLRLLLSCFPNLLLALAAVSRLDIQLHVAGMTALQSSWLVFLLASGIMWMVGGMAAALGAHYKATHRQRSR